ncbi:MAG TPA: hypothetical protein PKU74_08200, partial [Candidatus Omnitrophota bacterium]|nr:hypothetical protein [Candidatus Omnitrophota bacterium]
PEIWVMNADGTGEQRLTHEDRWHNAPDWSPDGKRVVFCANYDGNINIYTMNIDGTDRRQITNYKAMDYTPQFSPDGAKIIYTSKKEGNADIWVYDCLSGRSTLLTSYEGRDYAPTYSPDGAKVAFISGLVGEQGEENLEVYVMDTEGENIRRVTRNLGSERHVAWSPDGKYLIYASSKMTSAAERLMVVDLQTMKAQALRFNRSELEAKINSLPLAYGIFSLLPESLRRKFYPDYYFGSERFPDWKY